MLNARMYFFCKHSSGLYSLIAVAPANEKMSNSNQLWSILRCAIDDLKRLRSVSLVTGFDDG